MTGKKSPRADFFSHLWENIIQIISFGFLGIEKRTSREWPYLNQQARNRLKAVIYMREIRKWNFQLWDIRLNGGFIVEEHFTLPVIQMAEIIIYEFGKQEELYETEINFNYAIFLLTAKGIIGNNLRSSLEELHRLKLRILSPESSPTDRANEVIPPSYTLAKQAILQLDNCLRIYWQKQHHLEAVHSSSADQIIAG